jgi:hypothetical protein
MRILLRWLNGICCENSLNKECGWKDGDRGGSARTQEAHRRKKKSDLTLTGLLMEGVTRQRVGI